MVEIFTYKVCWLSKCNIVRIMVSFRGPKNSSDNLYAKLAPAPNFGKFDSVALLAPSVVGVTQWPF
jgi:hypothetical protein